MVRVIGNAFIRVQPLEGLRAELSASVNYYDLEGSTYSYTDATSKWTEGEGQNSSGGHNTRRTWSTLIQGLVNYDRTFGKHGVNVMLGASSEKTNVGFTTNRRLTSRSLTMRSFFLSTDQKYPSVRISLPNRLPITWHPYSDVCNITLTSVT